MIQPRRIVCFNRCILIYSIDVYVYVNYRTQFDPTLDNYAICYMLFRYTNSSAKTLVTTVHKDELTSKFVVTTSMFAIIFDYTSVDTLLPLILLLNNSVHS